LVNKWTKAMFLPISADAWSGLWRKQQKCLLDLERGNFLPKGNRQAIHQEAADACTAPPRLLAHLRRWNDRKLIATCFVEFNGKPVASVKKGFKTAVELAGLPGKVTPHVLRHTAATWLMRRGVSIWEAA